MLKFEKLIAAALGFLALGTFLPRTADATATYTYTGTNYTDALAPYTSSMSLGASLTFAGPLAPLLSNFDASGVVIAFDFNDGVRAFDETSGVPFGVAVDTDGFGDITGWAIGLESPALFIVSSCNWTHQGQPLSVGSFTVCNIFPPDTSAVGDDVLNFGGGPIGLAGTRVAGTFARVPEPDLLLLVSLGWCACEIVAVWRRS